MTRSALTFSEAMNGTTTGTIQIQDQDGTVFTPHLRWQRHLHLEHGGHTVTVTVAPRSPAPLVSAPGAGTHAWHADPVQHHDAERLHGPAGQRAERARLVRPSRRLRIVCSHRVAIPDRGPQGPRSFSFAEVASDASSGSVIKICDAVS